MSVAAMDDGAAAAPRPRWRALDRLLLRPGRAVGPGFDPSPDTADMLASMLRVLVVGAGGLGCELLKDLALSGFGNIDVIDMDTVDVSNLNRQFLFTLADVGQPKAVVAARAVAARVAGVTVTPHYARIEDKPADWYAQFHIIVLGLDSLEARRHMNAVACAGLAYGDDGAPDPATIKPVIDGGTEGFRGHVRVIVPGVTPCFECTLWLFPPQTTYPLCTLAETPRSPPHCVEYARLILWPQERGEEEFDADVEEHMDWVHTRALARAAAHGIPPFPRALTAGVAKRIVPAIASTNAIVAAACALEALKAATLLAPGLNNYMLFTGGDGVYAATQEHARDGACAVCSPGVPLAAPGGTLLGDWLERVRTEPALASLARGEGGLAGPTVATGDGAVLAGGGVYAEETAANRGRPLAVLLAGEGPHALVLNDRTLPAPVRVRLTLT